MFVTARKMADLKVVDAGEQLDRAAPDHRDDPGRVQAPEVADQRLVALPKPRVPAGQGELPTRREPDHRATS